MWHFRWRLPIEVFMGMSILGRADPRPIGCGPKNRNVPITVVSSIVARGCQLLRVTSGSRTAF